jgi:hypothetical protein
MARESLGSRGGTAAMTSRSSASAPDEEQPVAGRPGPVWLGSRIAAVSEPYRRCARSASTFRDAVIGVDPGARWSRVRIETDDAAYEGRLRLPDGTDLVAEIASDDGAFLELIGLPIGGALQERLIAVEKRAIRTLRVLGGGVLAGSRP